jgi:hypothetical protein
MSRNNTSRHRNTWILALAVIALAVVGGLSLFDTAEDEPEPAVGVMEPSTVIATSCSGFDADAHRLFNQAGAAVLRGTFARGDHVHLAIDLRGTGLSWETTGALGEGPHLMPSFLWLFLLRTTKLHSHTTTTTHTRPPVSSSTVSNGNISGYARWEMDFDIATAGDGALTINQTSVNEASRGPLVTPLKVAVASCIAAKTAPQS